VTLQITGVQLYDPTNGLVTMTVVTPQQVSANRRLEWKRKENRLRCVEAVRCSRFSQGGEKTCGGAVPSDDEWCAWARAQRTVRHFLGAGNRHSEDVDLPKIKRELVRQDPRRQKTGPEFDDAEAGMVIGRISSGALWPVVEREGINYRIEMKVPGARVVHDCACRPRRRCRSTNRASTTVVARAGGRSRRARSLEPRAAPLRQLHVSQMVTPEL